MTATAERIFESVSKDRRSQRKPIGEGRLVCPPGADGSPPLVREIHWREGSIDLFSELLFGQDSAGNESLRRRTANLSERLFAHARVESLTCDRQRGVLTVRLNEGPQDIVSVMVDLCRSLIHEASAPHRQALLLRDQVPDSSFEISRFGRLLTFWRIEESGTASISLADPFVSANSRRYELVEDALIHADGVGEVIADVRRGRIRIEAMPGHRLDTELLLHTIEQTEAHYPLVSATRGYPRFDLRWPILTIALAAAAQWLSPLFWCPAALMIVWLNFPMLRRGLVEMRNGVFGLPVLTVLIVAGTMIGGALFAASLMTLTSRFWQNRYFEMLALAQSEWLGQLSVSEGKAVRCLSNSRKEVVRTERLKQGDIIEIKAPEPIPVDGDWIDGEGEVIQAFGETVVGKVSEGEVAFRLFAGGWLRDGRIRMRVSAAGEMTRASKVREEILRSSGVLKGTTAVNEHGQAFAEKTVAPSLALAGLGLVTAGLSEAVAVLRPDYAMGVGMGEGLQRLRLGAEALHEGFLVRKPGAVLALDSIELWIVENGGIDDRSLQRMSNRVAVAKIVAPSRIELTTRAGQFLMHGFTAIDDDDRRCALIRSLKDGGLRKIGWIGDAESFPRTAAAVDIALSTSADFESPRPAAAVVHLASGQEPNWNLLFDLVEHARHETHATRLRAIGPNVAAVGGALLMGLDSLAAVVLTNLGIHSVHRRIRKPDIGNGKAHETIGCPNGSVAKP